MREWRGLKVPCEPKKEWRKTGAPCEEVGTARCYVGIACCCVGIACRDCIYSYFNSTAREQFYQECFPEKPKSFPQRDAKGRFRKKGGAEMMYYWEGLKVPVDPKREWGEWMCSGKPCPGTPAGIKCGYGKTVTCSECVYARRNSEARRRFYEQYYGKWPTFGKIEYPKLTVEVFNRPDCPDWARWAAVDIDGQAAWYSKKPVLWRNESSTWTLLNQWYRSCTKEDPFGGMVELMTTRFDASDWCNSLIERPQKELPKLTQTAFHCPDCPKEATKLKVFPANHVVALDKDDKVLEVMELQCKEGEVKKADWLYRRITGRLYRTDDYRQDVPKDAEPVVVQYYPPGLLVGRAVRSCKTGKDYLISSVDGMTVTLQGIEGKELLSMISLVQFYTFTKSGQLCCSFYFMQ